MRKFQFGLLALAITASGPALAQGFWGVYGAVSKRGRATSSPPDWERDLSVSIGTKVWLNEWTRDSFFSNTFVSELVFFRFGRTLW